MSGPGVDVGEAIQSMALFLSAASEAGERLNQQPHLPDEWVVSYGHKMAGLMATVVEAQCAVDTRDALRDIADKLDAIKVMLEVRG